MPSPKASASPKYTFANPMDDDTGGVTGMVDVEDEPAPEDSSPTAAKAEKAKKISKKEARAAAEAAKAAAEAAKPKREIKRGTAKQMAEIAKKGNLKAVHLRDLEKDGKPIVTNVRGQVSVSNLQR